MMIDVSVAVLKGEQCEASSDVTGGHIHWLRCVEGGSGLRVPLELGSDQRKNGKNCRSIF